MDVESTGLQKLVAGASAGAFESLITYPTEYIKTRQQLARGNLKTSPWGILAETLGRPQPLKTLYGGASAFCLSNASKSAVRFFTFDRIRAMLWTDPKTGRPTAQANLVAGLLAGVTESVLVVTPGETIKTKLIDDRQRLGGPQFKGSFDAVRQLLQSQGVRGIYQGVVPVTMKQSFNAMVRFTSYNWFLAKLQDFSGSSYKDLQPVLAGSCAGIVTVYCTMPFDTLKTRLQSLGGGQQSRGTLQTLQLIFRNEGLLVLWKGTTPRLIRLTVSGAISFSVYEQTIRLLSKMNTRSEFGTKQVIA
ncbi:hypothetical protein KCU85_g8435, partial [Aureobasidium melanogenum]